MLARNILLTAWDHDCAKRFEMINLKVVFENIIVYLPCFEYFWQSLQRNLNSRKILAYVLSRYSDERIRQTKYWQYFCLAKQRFCYSYYTVK